jgi:hypothetical protein
VRCFSLHENGDNSVLSLTSVETLSIFEGFSVTVFQQLGLFYVNYFRKKAHSDA